MSEREALRRLLGELRPKLHRYCARMTGSAIDGERAYFGVADGNQQTAGELHAVRLDTGERVWLATPKPPLCGERMRGCTPSILAAITVIPGVVFAGSQDGGIRGVVIPSRVIPRITTGI